MTDGASQPSAPTGDAPLLRGASGATLAQQLADRFAERIAQRWWSDGARLPSVRACAQRHRVSPATVVSAYDLLQARGLVEARAQRGFFVRGATAAMPMAGAAGRSAAERRGALAAAAPGGGPPPQPPPAPVDATALIRGMFGAHGGTGGAGPGAGTLPESWLDAPLLQRALRRAAGDPAGWLRYGEPAGDSSLREALSQRLRSLGIDATPAQVVTTVGATHALDLVARTLAAPGDAVLVDEPGWAVEFARLTRQGMRLLPVPRGPDGPDLAVMAALARAHRPRLYVTVSVLHNPTGGCLSAGAAHRVLQLADQHGFTVVEDDTYAWLAPPHALRLAQLDGLQRTVHVSGFSKILAPQWRVGFIAASPSLAERLVDTKLLTTLTTPALLERAVAQCLSQGWLQRHATRIGVLLDAARQRTVRLAQDAGCRFVAPPAGLFGWIDTGVDTEALARRLIDEGWLTAPGALFHAAPRPTTLMRVNFATAQDARFWRRLALARRTPANSSTRLQG